MPIDKVKFPNGETEDIRDSRVPGIDSAPTANSANLVTSGGVKSALDGKMDIGGVVSDFNTETIPGNYAIDYQVSANRPPINYGQALVLNATTDTVAQLAFNYNSGSAYFRGGSSWGSTWNSWREFAFKDDLSTALSGYLPLTGGTVTSSGAAPLLINSTSGTESGIAFLRNSINKAWIGYHDSIGAYLYNTTRNGYLAYKDDGSLLFENQKVWHAGNDGSGSGLDADLLDGKHASGFVTNYGQHMPITEVAAIGYGQANDDAEWVTYGPAIIAGIGPYKMLLQSTYNEDTLLWKRYTNGTYGSWKQIAFTDSNVASATNADTVDGKHASDFIGVNDNAASATRIKETTLEDEEFTYQVTPVHDIADGYRIDRVKGRTLAWNQLLDHPEYLSFQWEDLRTYIRQGFGYFQVLEGHVYLLKVEGDNAALYKIYGLIKMDDYTKISYASSLAPATLVTSTFTGGAYLWEYQEGTTSFNLRLNVFDLTLMFGAGNEPSTVEEFEAMFPETYYDYNPGELINNSAEAIETEAADSSWTSRLALGLGSIKVKDSSGNILELNGLASAGSVYDVISGGHLTKNVGRLVLTGSESWGRSIYGSIYCFILPIPDSKLGSSDGENSLYTQKRTAGASDIPDKTLLIDGYSYTYNGIFLRDDTYSNVADFKAYLAQMYAAGTPLVVHYVLATPVTYDLVSPIPLSGKIDGNGTMRVISNGLSTPFKGDITYGCNPGQMGADASSIKSYLDTMLEIKVVDGVPMEHSLMPIYSEAVTTVLQTSQPSDGMLPNRQYVFGELSGDTTFSMAAGASGVTNHYYWTFSTPSTAPTITWPAAITSWYGGSAPTINASKHYEVSVLDGVAICMEV